jgi:hypothetical protein
MLERMYAAGPRLDRRFLEDIVRLDDPTVSIAETYRRLRALAEQIGVPRPSYERVRIELRAARERAQERGRARELALELAFNTRPADAVIADLLNLVE